MRANYLNNACKLFLAVSMFLFSSTSVQAESVTEDFENVTLVDAEGNVPSSSWTTCTGLSNGWKIIGGSIQTSDYADYQLANKIGSGWLSSDYYLSSSSTSVNSAYVFIPVKVIGQVQLFAKSNLTTNSKKTSSIKVYEATAEGTITDSILYTYNPEKGASWRGCYFDIEGEEGKYIALNLVYTDVDDITFNKADSSAVEPTLSLSATSIDFGTTQTAITSGITVRSNFTTTVSFALSGDSADAFSIKENPTTLTANTQASVTIEMNAAEAGSYSALLTITAGELTKTVELTGIWEEKQPDQQPENWKGEDFNAYNEDDEMPMGWVADGWSIGEPFMLDTPALVVGQGGGTLTTPIFEVTDKEALQFYFSKTAIGWMSYASKLIISWSTDKEEWTEIANYDKTEEDGVKVVELPAAGSYYVRFVANDRTYLDDFQIIDNPNTNIKNISNSALSRDNRTYQLDGRLSTIVGKHIVIKGKKKYITK